MPMYMKSSGNGNYFRSTVPAPLRNILDKREIKISLGGDCKADCRRAREEWVRSDQLFYEVWSALTKQAEIARNPYARYEALQPKTELTDDLKRRAYGFGDDDPDEFRSEAASMLVLLKNAWRDADFEPFLPALHTTLFVVWPRRTLGSISRDFLVWRLE